MDRQANVRRPMRLWKVVKLCAVVGVTAGCSRPVRVPADAGVTAAVLDAGPAVPVARDLLVALPVGGPEGHARLRVQISAAHETAHIDGLVAALKKL